MTRKRDVRKTDVAGEEQPLWQLNQFNDQTYNTHMSSMNKEYEQVGTGSELVPRWRPTPENARVDYRMCEVYQVCAAYMRGINLLPELAEFEAARQAAIEQANQPNDVGGVERPDGRPFIAQRT
jgi:hypothetical protein